MNTARPTNLEFARAAAAVHRAMNLLKHPAVECATAGVAMVAAQPGVGGDVPSANPNCADVVCERGGITPATIREIVDFYCRRACRAGQ
jgi:hypothetical protein